MRKTFLLLFVLFTTGVFAEDEKSTMSKTKIEAIETKWDAHCQKPEVLNVCIMVYDVCEKDGTRSNNCLDLKQNMIKVKSNQI